MALDDPFETEWERAIRLDLTCPLLHFDYLLGRREKLPEPGAMCAGDCRWRDTALVCNLCHFE